MVNFEELKSKFPSCHHPPKEGCKYCGGTGIRHKVIFGKEIETACICIYVDHDICDTAQELLNETIRKIREE